MIKLYRIQDDDGRGPFKPGFSHNWLEPNLDRKHLPPWFAEFNARKIISSILPIEHLGCACKDKDQLRMWFSEDE